MKVTMRLSSGGSFDITLDPSITILEFKEIIEKEQNIPVAQQRLIYKGRILKDPMTVSSYSEYHQ
jgi:ubiquilin